MFSQQWKHSTLNLNPHYNQRTMTTCCSDKAKKAPHIQAMSLSTPSDIRRIGFLGWFTYSVGRFLDVVSGGCAQLTSLWIYAQNVSEIPSVSARQNDRIQVRVVGIDQLPESAFDRPTDAISERFAQGSICIAALKDAELVGFMWLQYESLRERLVRCDFVPLPNGRACWDFDVFVAPPFRMSRTFGRLWYHAKSQLQARGIETTLSWIAFDNIASRRAHERMGARRIGWTLILTVAKAQLLLASTSPYIHFSISEANRAKVLVRAPCD